MRPLKLDLATAGLTPEELAIAKGILVTRGPRRGCLRATRPDFELCNGQTAYIWRQVVFVISDEFRHTCLPVMAESYLHGPPGERSLSGKERKELVKQLEAIATRIVDIVPKSEWYGVLRWGHVLGMLKEEG